MSRVFCSRQCRLQAPQQPLLPFLYQTPTIQGLHHQNVTSGTVQKACRCFRSASSTSHDLRSEDVPPNFFRIKAQAMQAKKPKPKSTITKAEREAFDSIMKMFRSAQPKTDTAKATSANHSEVDFRKILDIFISSEAEKRKEPMRRNWGDSRNSRFAPIDINLRSDSDYPPTAAYPSRSDAAAELAKMYTNGRNTQSRFYLQPEQDTQEIVKTTALAIMQAISASFEAALSSQNPAPDIAMWRVCEDNIFSLITLLKPTSSQSSELSLQQQSDNDITTKNYETENHENSQPPTQQNSSLPSTHLPTKFALLIPSDCPTIPLLTQLYPAALLLALRLYYKHLPTSLFATSLAPRIRELGPTSYVLGANTYFYNALMTLRWDIYSDLRSIDALLSEMQRGGVDMDRSTFTLIKRIRTERRRDLGLANVENWNEPLQTARRPRSWWERREQIKWYHRVCVEWSDSILNKLTMRGEADMLVMREGPEDEDMNEDEDFLAYPAEEASAPFY